MAKDNGGPQIPGFSISVGPEIAHVVKPPRRTPRVQLHIVGDHHARLFIDGFPSTAGSIDKVTGIMRKAGMQPGDRYLVVTPNGAQHVLQLRSKEQRDAGVSAIVKGDTE